LSNAFCSIGIRYTITGARKLNLNVFSAFFRLFPSSFGLCYRTVFGNDVEGEEYGYKLHLIYGAMAAPSEKAYASINDSPEAITFSWEVTTTPVPVTGFKPTATLVIDSTKVVAGKLTALEDLLYGTVALAASLPTPDEVIAILQAV